jgi:hypothetical protein
VSGFNATAEAGAAILGFFKLKLDSAAFLPYHWNLRQTQDHGANVL